MFLVAFRILTVRKLSWGDVFPGACVAAVAWLLLQVLGGYIVGHQLQSASEVYGVFAVVIGLLAWMALGGQMTLFAAEVNVVRKERLWPRSLFRPPLTEADEQAYRRAAIQEERLPEESVKVQFDHESEEQAAARGPQGTRAHPRRRGTGRLVRELIGQSVRRPRPQIR